MVLRPSRFTFICNVLTDRHLSRSGRRAHRLPNTPDSNNITPLNYCCSNKYKCYTAIYLLLFIGLHRAVINCCNATFNLKPSIIRLSWPSVCKFHKPDSPLLYPSTWHSDFQQEYLQQGNELHCVKRRLYKLQPTCRHDHKISWHSSLVNTTEKHSQILRLFAPKWGGWATNHFMKTKCCSMRP